MFPFKISVTIGYRILTFTVEKLSSGRMTERYVVKGKNGQIMLENNRPLLEHKNLHHRPCDWKQTAGPQLTYQNSLQKICAAIDKEYEKRNKR